MQIDKQLLSDILVVFNTKTQWLDHELCSAASERIKQLLYTASEKIEQPNKWWYDKGVEVGSHRVPATADEIFLVFQSDKELHAAQGFFGGFRAAEKFHKIKP